MIPSIALAAVVGTVDISDTSSTQFRATSQGAAVAGGPTGGAGGAAPGAALTAVSPDGVDVGTVGRALLRFTDRVLDYSLSYSPQVWWFDVETGADSITPLLFQSAAASVAWHRGNVRVTLTETGSYGQFNTASLYAPVPTQTAPTQTPTAGQGAVGPGQAQAPPVSGTGQPVGLTSTLQIVPAETTVNQGSSNTDLGLGLPLGQRASLGFLAGYSWGGGLDTQSQAVLPLQFGPHAGTTLGFSAGVDRWTTGLFGSLVETRATGACVGVTGAPGTLPAPGATCRERAEFATAQETWVHAFSRALSLTVGAGAGVGYTRTETAPVTETTSVIPTAQLTFTYRFGHGGMNALVLGAQGIPMIDPVTGRVIEPVTASLSISDDITRRVRLRSSVVAGQTIPFDDPSALTIVTGILGADFRVGKNVTLSMGQALLWQDQQGYGTIFSTSTYVALSVRAQTLRLR